MISILNNASTVRESLSKRENVRGGRSDSERKDKTVERGEKLELRDGRSEKQEEQSEERRKEDMGGEVR